MTGAGPRPICGPEGVWPPIRRRSSLSKSEIRSQVEFLDAASRDASGAEGGEPAYAPGEEPFWLTKERRLQATVIHQRLVADHGFVGSYQRVKLYVAEAEPPELHRRFEVLPGAQAQVDWGDEGFLETPDGAVHVWSFHMTLSLSRDPFCCFVTRRRARHRGLRPDQDRGAQARAAQRRGAAAPRGHRLAAHYGFSIVVAPARRPQLKGRVERQVSIVRHGVLEGRDFSSPNEMDDAFGAWLPLRRAPGPSHPWRGDLGAGRARPVAPSPPYPSAPTWCATATCARWARTAWSASRPACTRCRAGRAPAHARRVPGP